MQNKIKILLDRLHEEGHINNNEYNSLMNLVRMATATNYLVDKYSNNSWEPYTKTIIPESKL